MHVNSRFITPIILVVAVIFMTGVITVWAEDLPPFTGLLEFNNGKDAGIKIIAKFKKGITTRDVVLEEVTIEDLKAEPEKAWICTYIGELDPPDISVVMDPYDEDDDFDCHEIKGAGPKYSGCPIFANPTYYLYGADAYRRSP